MAGEIKKALVSAWDKNGLVEFAEVVREIDPEVEFFGSAGSAAKLQEGGIDAHNVSEFTGSEPWLGHKVATLSEEVSAGLLADYEGSDRGEMEERGIPYIDMALVDLYPLIQTVRDPEATEEQVRAKTDVGGPTMLHAGAKGRRIVLSRAEQREEVAAWMKQGMPNAIEFRRKLAAIAEWEAARHIMESALYLGGSAMYGFMGERHGEAFKGENGLQVGALYVDRYAIDDPLSLDKFVVLREAESKLGLNNWTDVSRSVQTLSHVGAAFQRNFGEAPAFMALGVKHGNACGSGIGDTAEEALIKTIESDQLALFGGTVTVNFELDKARAELLMKHNQGDGKNLIDVVVAPSVTDEALQILHRKDGRLRVVVNPALTTLDENSIDKSPRVQSVRGGMLVQDNYTFVLDLQHNEMDRTGELSHQQERDILQADAICRTSNSNTITVVRDGQLLANAVGQQARVYAAELAVARAHRLGHSLEGASAASDSFFAFPDAPMALIEAGVGAIFTTRGSKRDAEIFEEINKAGAVVYTLPDGIGRGFSHHAA